MQWEDCRSRSPISRLIWDSCWESNGLVLPPNSTTEVKILSQSSITEEDYVNKIPQKPQTHPTSKRSTPQNPQVTVINIHERKEENYSPWFLSFVEKTQNTCMNSHFQGLHLLWYQMDSSLVTKAILNHRQLNIYIYSLVKASFKN